MSLLAMSPARADGGGDPPDAAKLAIQSMAMVATAEAACPGFQVNEVAADGLASRLKADEMARAYDDFTKRTAARYVGMLVKDRAAFCGAAWTAFGDDGVEAHVLVRMPAPSQAQSQAQSHARAPAQGAPEVQHR